MSKIAYILLCHKDPSGIIAQAERLSAAGDYLAIHFDANAAASDYQKVVAALAHNPNVVFTQKRIKCGWGEWSLVAATLEAVKAAEAAFPRASHFYMLSGDCMPIKTAEYTHAYLDQDDCDYIESFDFFRSDWIKTGIKEERLIYRHWFNERKQKTWFYRAMEWQKKAGLERQIPTDIEVQIGSQWWCLRRQTIEAILAFVARRKDVIRFFKTTWIPDETFFQTLVRHLVPSREIRARTLTFLIFTDYGMPVTLYNDHYNLLLGQDYLFARKVSPDALELKAKLGALYGQSGISFAPSNEGKQMFQFLTLRGREGRRFGPRFWERDTSLGRSRSLLIMSCKKWHVAKRINEQIRRVTGLHAVDYLFNESTTKLPDLGGIEGTIEKRTRHRRALVRMLYDSWDTTRLLFCIDPASIELVHDFYADKADVRILEIECSFSDEYLIGHAARVGLASARTSKDTLARLLPTIRHDMRFESDRLRGFDFRGYSRLSETADLASNIAALRAFLDIDEASARTIAQTAHLFVD